jgi:hypothetical protein
MLRSKRECSKLDAQTAIKLPSSLSSLQQASQSTAKRVSPSILSDRKMSVGTQVLIRNKHGHDEEMAGKEERKSPLTFSNNSSAESTISRGYFASESER